MKYRIIESPRVGKKPLFYIKAWGHKLNTSLFGKNKECWCYMDTRGYPINEGYRSSPYSDYPGSFKSLKKAQDYLDKVIVYRKKETKTVFEIEA